MLNIQQKVEQLTKLPSPSPRAPDVSPGHVLLYQDNSWDSRMSEIKLSDYPPKERHRVDGSIFDNATWIAFNLPLGTVVTFMDNVEPMPEGKVADLSNCGCCVDLVGTGKTEAVDLDNGLLMNDKISTFFWRKVDMNLGAIELFDDQDFKGNRVTLFLSEWAPNETHAMDRWWINDRVTSVRWKSLDRESAILFDNRDGKGDRWAKITGRSSNKETAKMQDQGFNDRVSAFSWTGLIPEFDEIKPITINKADQVDIIAVTDTATITNLGTTTVTRAVKFLQERAVEITTSTTDSYATGIAAEYSFQEKVGFEPVGEVTVGWKVAVTFDYTLSQTATKTRKETFSLATEEEVPVPPRSKQSFYLTITTGSVNGKVYETTAERWYSEQVDGSVPDRKNSKDLYKRTEPVEISISGGLRGDSDFVAGEQVPIL